jgi:drug/metabolite transporter (DMT)-like permease
MTGARESGADKIGLRAWRREAWRLMPAPMRGALLALVAMAIFPAVHVIVRHVSQDMHTFEVVFFRNFMGLAAMTPWFLRNGLRGLRTDHLSLHALRATTGLCAMTAWFYGLAVLPLATATALSFTSPLFVTLLAPFILAEVVGWRRVGAVLMGFLGALIIIRPDTTVIEIGAVIVVGSAFFAASSQMMVKKLSRTEKPDTIVAWMLVILTPASLIPALFVWQWPSIETLLWMAAVGIGTTAAHMVLVRAIAQADASFVTHFQYARLPYAALFGFFLFAEVPGPGTWIGAGVIVASAVYITTRETRRKVPPVPPVEG